MSDLAGVVRAAASALAALAVVAGCSSAPRGGEAKPSPAAAEVRRSAIWRGADSGAATWEEMIAQAAAADVVVIGEMHGHSVGLPWAAALFEDLLKRAPNAALSLEFFERDDQSRLDDYLRGLVDEKNFLKRTDRSPGNYPDGHRAMLEAAKASGRPVVASNAPWETIKFMRGKDYAALETLSAEQRRMFCVPAAPPEGRYRADYDALMGPFVGADHAHPEIKPERQPTPEEMKTALDAGFRTQSLWDWTMGESVARAVDAGSHPVVHVIGRFHSDFFGGMPQAVLKLRSGTKVVTVSIVDRDATGLEEGDRERADFVVYVGPSPEEHP